MSASVKGSTAVTPITQPALGPILAALVITGVTELTFQRTFYRLGIYIPKQGAFWDIYRASTGMGTFSLNLASILALVVLAFFAIHLHRSERRGAAVLCGLLIAVSLASTLATSNAWLSVGYRALFLAITTSLLWSGLREGTWTHRAATLALLCAYGLSSYYGLAGGLMMALGLPGSAWGSAVALRLGEAFVVALGPAFFLAWRRDAPIHAGRALAWSALPTLVLLAALVLQPRMTGILVMWTVGLGLALPLPLYVISFWLFIGAVIGSLMRRATCTQGLALVLLLVAGYFPQSTYELDMAVVALLLWTLPTVSYRTLITA